MTPLSAISNNTPYGVSLGDITSSVPALGTELSFGESTSFGVSRTVLACDPDPLLNTVTVHYHPAGFPNDITADDNHSVDIIHPHTNIYISRSYS